MIENPFARKVIDAANFADLVRTRFANEPERYRQFFDMMLWHERHPCVLSLLPNERCTHDLPHAVLMCTRLAIALRKSSLAIPT